MYGYFVLWAYLGYWGELGVGRLLRSGLGWALKTMLLAQDDGELLLEWLVAEKRIDRLTARNYVLLCAVAPVCLCQQVFDARVCSSQRLLAEKALPALFE
nr:hypothetical protein [uncultured Piscinibacter sp.]